MYFSISNVCKWDISYSVVELAVASQPPAPLVHPSCPATGFLAKHFISCHTELRARLLFHLISGRSPPAVSAAGTGCYGNTCLLSSWGMRYQAGERHFQMGWGHCGLYLLQSHGCHGGSVRVRNHKGLVVPSACRKMKAFIIVASWLLAGKTGFQHIQILD